MAARRQARREVHSEDEQVGQDREFDIPSDGSVEVPESEVEAVEGPSAGDAADLEAFMNERMTIIINDTHDPNAKMIPEVYVNGVVQRFKRNEEITVKRMFVEALVRAKQTAYQTREITRGDGVRDIRMSSNTGLRYPFSVMHDPNPNGPAWLRKILAEG